MKGWAMPSPRPARAAPPGYQATEQMVRDLHAADYERWFLATKGRFFDSRERGLFRSMVRAVRFQSVLEIGCGTGRITETVAPHVGSITALDFSVASVAILRAKGIGNVRVDCANICEGLPFAAGSFQLVLACQVLQHLMPRDLLTVVRECARVLEPGGQLAFTAYNLDHFRCTRAEETAENGLYSRRFSRASVRELAVNSGFALQELKYYKAIPSRLARRTRFAHAQLLLDRAMCALPGLAARLAGYLFAVLVRTS